ncbi:ectonucleotide pyrophosphatase/phosphodiesterase family member 3 isoform X1 [Xyrauchen texanus]|uniref:ectonucleotide pyrophosphatase/phosphodiesterase family member 3 isoform X1 n=1 Tax=Xyrauchen texanus TaxID=154827 RepID=UPI002241DA84|nr:ectonucleotide pyrophosphatase/phosphodiesterase family member 3 isoform X1 [Xyrauchen texanus]XP_051991795.1 ectonucleotide pyrophosphatase/phosphodiesterase family member 3 isoform X1 [Xyrauchen texanus]
MDFRKDVLLKKNVLLISVLLAVAVVTIILGLGLGLGLQLQNCKKKDESVSCRNRCYEPFDENSASCRCDTQCVASNNCCYDYQDICLQPAESWECTALRCGEVRLTDSKCHCSHDCMSAKDCCSNYNSVCTGDTEWVQDECVDINTPKCPASFKRQPLLLVSLDGLRAEYLQTWRSLIPVLDKIRQCGTSTPFMQAVFPSKTFPNHYSIATGLYAESHGLVDNNMYDPVFDASFSLSSSEKDNPRWYQGQPIWNTVTYQGLKAGTFFWPGSDVAINGTFPNIYMRYNGSVPFEERVFTLLKWLQLPDSERPDFFTLYLEEPDKSGHSFGPVSGGLITGLQGVDRVIGQLMNGLKQLNLHQCVNIIIVADHGMEETSCDRKEVLQEFVGDVNHLYVNEGPFGRIRAKDKTHTLDTAALVANMTCKRTKQQIKPYLKHHLPKRFHYANNRRIEDVNVLVNPRWLFERYPGSLTFCSGGNHGYDNDVYSMQAAFLSLGPKFLSQTEVDPFANIELYNLMCDVLGISPFQNNGTHGSLNHLLRAPPHTPRHPQELSEPLQCPLTNLQPTHTLNCSCPQLDGMNLNSRLNLTDTEVSASMKRHMSFGRPRILHTGAEYCLLYQHGFINAYNTHTHTPVWSSFTVDKPVEGGSVSPVVSDCLRADVRIPANLSATCDQYESAVNITHSFLYPPNLNSSSEDQFDALTLGNVVPMYPQFKRLWQYFQEVLLLKYASQYNSINVVTGPAYDYDYDGHFDTPEQIQQFVAGTDIPLPTHYFAVLTSCKDDGQTVNECTADLQTVSFLFPHREENSESCTSDQPESQWAESLLWMHQSRVRDVEWITGLDFYQDSDQPIPELLRLKTRPTAAIHPKL